MKRTAGFVVSTTSRAMGLYQIVSRPAGRQFVLLPHRSVSSLLLGTSSFRSRNHHQQLLSLGFGLQASACARRSLATKKGGEASSSSSSASSRGAKKAQRKRYDKKYVKVPEQQKELAFKKKNDIEDSNVVEQRLKNFEGRVGMRWTDSKLLLQAFTHPSFSHGKDPAHERLEFFGDRLLSFLVCEHLALKYPNLPVKAVHEASRLFAANESLTTAGKKLGLQDFIRWTPNSEQEDLTENAVIANTMEALIASLYHEQGLKAAREFVTKFIIPDDPKLDIIPYLRQKLPRNTLADLFVRRGSGAPYYVVLQEAARHTNESMFVVGVYSESKLLGQGSGRSVKKAEQAAAQDALNKIWGEKFYTKLPSDEY